MNYKINQVVKVTDEFKTPRDKKGGRFNQYRITKVMRVNVRAVNLATFVPHTLRKEHIKLVKTWPHTVYDTFGNKAVFEFPFKPKN